MSNSMLFYKNIEALSRETHAKLKIEATNKYDFAADHYWVPLAGVEFFRAAENFPVVFLNEGDNFVPIALLGLEPTQNLFVDEKSLWREATYIPAFIRRYPFVLASTGKDAEEQLTVCLDRDYIGFNDKNGEALFDGKGEATEFLNNAMVFLSNYNNDMALTQEFVKILQDKKLLESKTVTITSGSGEKFDVQNVYIINEEAFRALEGDVLAELNRKGMLGWVFAHLMSLNNFPQLFDLFLKAKDGHKEESSKVEATKEVLSNKPLPKSSTTKNKSNAKPAGNARARARALKSK